MKKELLLLVVSISLTMVLSLSWIRWLAPGLLGISPDLQLVQVDKKVPPYYDNVFRERDYRFEGFIINDPYTIQRAKPLYPDIFAMGPNDILGFRNKGVPNFADIITIGDSQTYGNNVMLDQNWPNRLKVYLKRESPVIYNMSCGAWNGVQYLEIFKKSIFFKPRVVVVAFYTGNDPLGAFINVYGSNRWKSLRLNPGLTKENAPRVVFPAPKSELWPVRFKDGTKMIFTPKLRLSSNRLDDPAVQTGYAILKEVGRQINELANKIKLQIIFTIIPTKELVYAERIRKEGINPPEDYQLLVRSEKKYISLFAAQLSGFPGAIYVDLLKPLKNAAQNSVLYPPDANGHPVAPGYDIIAKRLSPVIEKYLLTPLKGLVYLDMEDGIRRGILVKNEGIWLFLNKELIIQNGWRSLDNIRVIKNRDIAGLPRKGIIYTIDSKKFGPSTF